MERIRLTYLYLIFSLLIPLSQVVSSEDLNSQLSNNNVKKENALGSTSLNSNVPNINDDLDACDLDEKTNNPETKNSGFFAVFKKIYNKIFNFNSKEDNAPVILNRCENDLDAYIENIKRVVQDRLGGDWKKICPVLKADAYGHGTMELMKVINELPITCVGVSTNADIYAISKAIGRENLAKFTIMRLKSQGVDSIRQIAVDYNIDVKEVVETVEDLINIMSVAKEIDRPIGVQLRVDLGKQDQFNEMMPRLKSLEKRKKINIFGIFSHFEREGLEEMKIDLDNFKNRVGNLVNKLGKKVSDLKIHMASSPQIVADFKESYLDFVRPGTLLYGQPNRNGDVIPGVVPVMKIMSKISKIDDYKEGEKISYSQKEVKIDSGLKTKRLARIPIGEKFGFKNATEVLINGKKYKIYHVENDELYIDLGNDKGISQGQEVILLGRSGKEEIGYVDITQKITPSDRISYEAGGISFERRYSKKKCW
ncbi:MAG: alanine racemase [Oligoflexia bacterium]|nr:alanine racemase [Oligoflexia bacterium]